MRRILALLLLALLCAAPSRIEAARPRTSKPRTGKKQLGRKRPAPIRAGQPASSGSTGTVRWVTAARAYLDRGSVDGLATGVALQLTRGGRPAGTCTIEWVAQHQASCPARGLRRGDVFRFDAKPAKPTPAVATLPPLPTATQLAQRQRALEAAAFTPVDFGGSGSSASLSRQIDALLTHQSWVGATASSAFHQERLDLFVRGAEVGAGFELSVDASVVQWTGRPDSFRSPHRASTQLFVREAELTRRAAGSALAVSAGRIWPWHAANLGTFDGAQVGWRSASGESEAGVFGGTLPDALNLAPSLRPLAGVYASFSGSSSDGLVRWWQQQTRAAWLPTSTGRRIELEALARGWLRQGLDAGIDARLSVGEDMAPALDALRLDAAVRPHERLELAGGLRYDGRALALLAPGATSLGVSSLRGDLSGSWEVQRHLRAGGTVMHVSDLETGARHTLLGPELSLPRLLDGAQSFSLGYLEGLGDSAGRSAFLQSVSRPFERLQLFARASWFHDSRLRELSRIGSDELGMFVSADLRLWSTVWLRGSLLSRIALGQSAGEEAPPWGLRGSIGVGGTY